MSLFGQKKDQNLATIYTDLVSGGVSSIDGQPVQVVEIGELGTWPRTNDAIVKFEYQSVEEPYIEVNGERRGNILHAYCHMADWTEKLIVDPVDGEIKATGYYGTPIGWVSYEPAQPAPQVSKKNKAPDDPRFFTVLEDSDAWRIATKVGQPAEDLISHNDIEDPHHVPAGTVLRLPYPPEKKKEARVITFELLDKPRKMHVVREGGARKWAFGNARTWGDITPSGPNYAEGANVDILMIAHVPLEEDSKEITAAYMMDSLAVGDYRNTGKINATIGFSHKHLADGHVELKKRSRPAPVAEEKVNTATVADIELALSEPEPEPAPVNYKATFKPLNEQRVARTFLANQDITVKEHDGHRPDRQMRKHQGVKIFGTFEKDGVLYGRPLGSVDSGLWFGIPMDKLIDEDELYNTTVDLPTRVAMHGSLTIQERCVVALSRVISVGTRIASLVKKQTKEQK